MTKAAFDAYPLQWPSGWKRSIWRKKARYSTDFASTRDDLTRSLRLLGAKRIVISCNIPSRRDGLPYSTYNEPLDPGVAVYFEMGDEQRVIACDRWVKVKHNLRAVYLATEALRSLERCGASEILNRAFMGFVELSSGESCWKVLGIERTSDQTVISSAYRKMALSAHPDRGGDEETMKRINAAYEEALRLARAAFDEAVRQGIK